MSVQEQWLFCDEYINFFNSSNINVFKLLSNGTKINVTSKLKTLTDVQTITEDVCNKIISYKTTDFIETLSIEFLKLPNSITGFFKDSLITSIEIHWDTFGDYDDYSYLFHHSQSLTSIDLSNFTFPNAKTIRQMFYSTFVLTKIKFAEEPVFDSVEDYTAVFLGATALTSIDLSSFTFNSALIVYGLFGVCTDLEYIKFRKESIFSSVQIFDYMFSQCNSFISLDITNFNFSSALSMDSMFYKCQNLESIKFPTESNYRTILIYAAMFYYCPKLKSIDLSGFYMDDIVDIRSIFAGCENLEYVRLRGNISWEKYFAAQYFDSYYRVYMGYMFESCISIKEINFLNINIHYNSNGFPFNNSLNGCLYFEYQSNIEKCQNYMGFYHCGDCINGDNEYYCSKKIQEEILNFYYFDNNQNKSLRSCFWSNNYTDFIGYHFIKRDGEIGYFINTYNYCEDYCEICSENRKYCIKCNYEKGVFKIESENTCSKFKPGKNYILDTEAKEWRKCNNRCQTCYIQSKSEIDHQCLLCNQNYFAYMTDFENLMNNKSTGINCYTISEVKKNTPNYFLNSNNLFEICDYSCAECKDFNNFCTLCNPNFYYIYENKNGTCFHEPLPKYGLINIEDKTFFKKCYHLCLFCNQITNSFLFQQCSKCDEINYTLDLYSLNQSYCIPKDKSNSYFVKDQTKWYINNNFDDLIIYDKDIIIDYQRLLTNEKFSEMDYTITNLCPKNKFYIVYSTRQCISSCHSSNLLENGIFMTKKLYLYNDICYDECPHGSIKDDINLTCIEINQFTTFNKNISIDYYLENYQENILRYLGEYANNSVGIAKNNLFTNYFYNQSTNHSFKEALNMPILHFDECIEKLRIYYKLDNSTNIFVGLMEYNDQFSKDGKFDLNSNSVNSTSYQFFINNGTILNYSVCLGMKIKVEKKVETRKYNRSEIKEIEDRYNINILNSSKELKDLCFPLNINGKDLTLYDKQLLSYKYKSPCDDNCIFQSFNYSNNYSTCLCHIEIKEENKVIKDKIKEENEIIETISKLLEGGNFKYFKCFSSFAPKKGQMHNWLQYFSYIHILIGIVFLVLYYKNNHKDLVEKFINIAEEKTQNKEEEKESEETSKKINTSQIIYMYNRINLNKIYDINNKDEESSSIRLKHKKNKSNNKKDKHKDKNIINYLEMNFAQALIKDKRNFIKIFYEFFSKKFFFGVIITDIDKTLYPTNIIIIEINILLHTFLFMNAILFSDKYISARYIYDKKNEIEYILTKEYERIILVFAVCFFIIKIIRWFLDGKSGIKEANILLRDGFTMENYVKKIENSRLIYIYKSYFGNIVILLLHLFYLFFITVFCNINSYTQLGLFLSLIISLLLNGIIYFIICLFISLFRIIALKKEKELLFKISNAIYELF